MRPAHPPRRPCARCGRPVHADRMVHGHGIDCATQLGLTGTAPDTGHQGPDLLDLLETEPADECDGWDRPADRP